MELEEIKAEARRLIIRHQAHVRWVVKEMQSCSVTTRSNTKKSEVGYQESFIHRQGSINRLQLPFRNFIFISRDLYVYSKIENSSLIDVSLPEYFYFLQQLYPTLPLLTLALCLERPELLLPSNPYMPPAKNTMNAPTRVPGDSLFPNNQILNSRLTSFRTFNTIVTVRAEAADARRLTPLMHAYCVKTFRTRYASWLGIYILFIPFWKSKGRLENDSWVGIPNGGDAASFINCRRIDGMNGMNNGRARRCE